MSEYVVDFGDKSSAFVGLAIAEAESHGATLKERVVRCRDCAGFEDDGYDETICHFAAMVKPNKDDFCSYGERRDA